MILRHIGLQLRLDEFPTEYYSPFSFRTRYVCNFLQRKIRPLRFSGGAFNMIVVEGSTTPVDGCPIESESAAVPLVSFDQSRYAALGSEEHHEFFLLMLQEGLEKCARFHDIPLVELLAAMDEFRRGGYLNEWTDQSKLLKPAGIRASLLCSLDTTRFVLTLRLERGKQVVFERPILETKPDELIFGGKFKTVQLAGDAVVVSDTFGRPTFSLPLASLP